MSMTTPALAADQLRKLAESLDGATDSPIRVYVTVLDVDYGAKQSTRTGVVDTIAGLFGLTAQPTMSSPGCWSYEASENRDGVKVRVETYIDAPTKRCACGAECAHTVIADAA